jgi:hypothetical protein
MGLQLTNAATGQPVFIPQNKDTACQIYPAPRAGR